MAECELWVVCVFVFFFQAEDGIRDAQESRGLGDVYKRQNWMREYLYVPLGGNRKGRARTYLNLWIVFLISGFWHGAAWNFVAWGAFHGFFLCLDKWAGRERTAKIPGWIGLPATFVLVLFSWVLFRAETLGHAVEYAGRMVDVFGAAPEAAAAIAFGPRHAATMAAGFVLCFGPAIWPRPYDFMRLDPAKATAKQAAGRFAVAMGLLAWSAAVLAY